MGLQKKLYKIPKVYVSSTREKFFYTPICIKEQEKSCSKYLAIVLTGTRANFLCAKKEKHKSGQTRRFFLLMDYEVSHIVTKLFKTFKNFTIFKIKRPKNYRCFFYSEPGILKLLKRQCRNLVILMKCNSKYVLRQEMDF